MDGWTKGTLGELCSIEIGGTPSRSNPEYWDTAKDTTNCWVSIKDLSRRTVCETAEQITDLGVHNSNVKRQPKGTVLLSFKLSIGRVAFAGCDLYTNEAIAGLRSEKLVPDFLYYGLQQWDLLQGVDQAIKGATLNKDKLKKIDFEYPLSQTEQKKIAEVLSKLDRAIEQTEALIAKQRRIKTGLMQDLLTKGIDEHGNIRSEATHAFKDSPLGRIPVEWDVAPLRNYLSFLSYGFTNPMPEALDGPYMVTAANVHGGKIDYDGCRKTQREAFDNLLTAKSRPRIGDVLITKDGTLGRIAVVDRNDVCINQSVAVLRFQGISNKFGAMLLSSPIYQELILAEAGGSTIKHIYISKLDKLQLATPSDISEQTRILDVLSNQDLAVTDTETELVKLRSVKDGLMHDLLTGERRVTPLLVQAAPQ